MTSSQYNNITRFHKIIISALKIYSLLKLHSGKLNWVLVYGPPRTGTSLLARLLSYRSKFCVVDVGLNSLTKFPPKKLKYIKFNKQKFHYETLLNLFISSHQGPWFSQNKFDRPIDLVVKQAALTPEAYEMLIKAYGNPSRMIFCIREPNAYYYSHLNKFRKVDNIVSDYLNSINLYQNIRGDIFEYKNSNTIDNYNYFLFKKNIKTPHNLIYKVNHMKQPTDELTDIFSSFKGKYEF